MAAFTGVESVMASTDAQRRRGQRGGFRRQRGMTAIGWIVVLALIGFFVMLILRLGPTYMEYFSVSNSMESLKDEPRLAGKTPSEVRKLLFRRFNINDVDNVGRDQVSIYKDGAGIKVAVEYEVRVPLMGNVDAMVSFDKEVTIR